MSEIANRKQAERKPTKEHLPFVQVEEERGERKHKTKKMSYKGGKSSWENTEYNEIKELETFLKRRMSKGQSGI